MPQGYGTHKTAFKDLTGVLFGRLKVLSRGKTQATRIYWVCKCECGEVKEISGVHLTQKKVVSCGCKKTERAPNALHRHPLYALYRGMIARCENHSNRYYYCYGEIGITVCSSWRESFSTFVNDIGPRPSATHSIDRIDPTKGYSPDNCRWATPKEQASNKRPRVKSPLLKASGLIVGRSVNEWIGRSPDSKPPPHVVERVFLRASKQCHISKREIRAGEAWEVEHVKPLSQGGENRETNMAPALSKEHKLKTAREALERAEERTIRQKHYGIKKPKRPIPGSRASGLRKRFNGTVERWT